MMSKRGKIDILSVFLVATIVLSIITTFIVLNHINAMITGWPTYTPTSAGQINVSIAQNLTLFLQDYNVTFGTGYVIPGKAHAGLNTSNITEMTTALLTSMNWTNTSNFAPKKLIIRNDGNVNASVTLTSNATAAQMIGGTNPDFKFNVTNKESYACVGTATDWTSMTGASQAVCTILSVTDTKDEIYVNFLLQIPYDVAGVKEAFVTFSATAVT